MILPKRIYYVPRLISALLIPVLFWFYLSPYIDFTVANVIDVKLPLKGNNANADKEINNIGNFIPLKYDHYRKIKIGSNEAKKNSNQYVSVIRKLTEINSENTGIEFILTKDNTYGDFVSLLNDFHISRHEYYGIDLETGTLIASSYYPKPEESNTEYQCLLCNDHIVSQDSYIPTFTDQILDNIKSSFENLWLALNNLPKSPYFIFFGFLIFLNISMLSIKERFQS